MAYGQNAAIDGDVAREAGELRRATVERIATATGKREIAAAHELGGHTGRRGTIVDGQLRTEERLQSAAGRSDIELERLNACRYAVKIIDIPVALHAGRSCRGESG